MFLALVTVSILGPAALADDKPPEAKEIYEARCAFCHGTDGKGDGPAGAALQPRPTRFDSPEFWQTAKLAVLKQSIKNGKPGTAMVPFGQSLTEAEVDALLAYLRAFAK